ncbi:MAG TPA: exodeoxyribonuclease VII large subunit [Nitrospirales bacterium]|nr:exodeoxyribonuclease VII large subunit [Nitrospirales bacterium]HIC05018.1 exodeoxyribonuclease VII large subunit [Nitrospirales bacterium]HIO22418.1 exodeoxyribonuclease VII large subunit [Nitrospirales bacterium]
MTVGRHPVPSAVPVAAYTVSELTGLIRASLESAFGTMWVEGEISSFRLAPSGHMYLTLKDATSGIRAVVFRGVAQRLRFRLEDGLRVVCRGRLTVYEPRGDYQIIVDALEPKGIGARQLALDQLKARLAEEGLFDPARKRALPSFPQQIGVVTSLGGAVVWDILKIVHRRFPLADILIYPVAVQGQSAGKDIARAIRVLNTRGSSDVLIVARGGGAAEDLWAFNEERVARAIYQSRIPVISAVGHEVDYTVADLVADYRAPTPSAAAEAATPNRTELVNRLRAYHTGLAQSFSRAFQQWRDQVETLNVMRLDPRAVLQRYLQRVDELEMRMSVCVARNIDRMRDAVESAGARLHALSPLAVLERGYAIVRHWPSLNVLRTVTDIRMHDRVQLQLSNGRLLCEVQEVQQ